MRIASQMKEEVVLLSSDAIRGEIYGDENCQRDPGHVFDIMHQRTIAALSQGISVIYDATNLSCKRRMNFLKSIAHIDCKKTCVVVVTTPEDIEERMKLRDPYSLSKFYKMIGPKLFKRLTVLEKADKAAH